MSLPRSEKLKEAIERLARQQQATVEQVQSNDPRRVEGGATIISPRRPALSSQRSFDSVIPIPLRPFSARQRPAEHPQTPVALQSPSERIALLQSMSNIRTIDNERRRRPVSARKTFLTGPYPVRPSHNLTLNSEKGVDPRMSHFLDISDFDDMDVHSLFTTDDPEPIGYSIFHESAFEGRVEPCRVLSYDESKGLLLIRWIQNGKLKHIRPLMVRPHWETESHYNDRLTRATSLRDEAEGALRLRAYINSRTDISDPSPDSELEAILRLVANGFPASHRRLMERCLEEVDEVRCFGLRRAVVSYEMRNPSYNAEMTSLLQLPKGETPAIKDLRACTGTLRIERRVAPFSSIKKYIGQELFVAHPQLYAAVRFAVNRWLQFDSQLLLELDCYPDGSPLPLVDFALQQSAKAKAIGDSLQNAWMNSIVGCLQSELSQTFNFFVDSLETFDQSRMKRFVRMLHLSLGGQLQTLVYASLESLRRFSERLLIPPSVLSAIEDEEQVPRKSREYLSSVGFECSKVILPPDLTRSDRIQVPEEPFGIQTETSTAVYGFQSLITGKLALAGAEVALVPQPEEIRQCFSALLEAIFVHTDCISDLTATLFPLLPLSATPLTKVAQETRESDRIVQRVKETLHRMLEQNLRGAIALLRLYQPFSYILTLDLDSFLADFSKKAASLEDYDYVCNHFSEHIDAVSKRSYSEVSFPLLRISTVELKHALQQKLQDALNSVLGILLEGTSRRIESTSQRFSAIFKELLIDPTSPEELKSLREFVDQVSLQMNELSTELDAISGNIHLLGKYGMMPDQKTFESFWETSGWPRKIAIVLDDIPFRLQTYRASFVTQLQEKSASMLTESQNISKLIGALSAFDNFDTDVDAMIQKIDEIDAALTNAQRQANTITSHERIFGLPATRWTFLKEAESQFAPFRNLWKTVGDSRRIDGWLDGTVEKLRSEEILSLHTTWSKDAVRLCKQFASDPVLTVASALKEKLDGFRAVLPLISALAKPSLLSRRRYVIKIGELVGIEKLDLQTKSLLELSRSGLLQRISEVQELSEIADQEYKIERALGKLKDSWQRVVLKTEPRRNTIALRETDTIQTLLDDSLLKCQTMLTSPYASALLNELSPWEERLEKMNTLLSDWLRCQVSYFYLQPIFSSEDFVAAMPNEAKVFQSLDAQWIALMEQTERFPYMLSRFSDEKLPAVLQDANQKLDCLMKELSRFLDSKRIAFPRFFFLSNEDLIEILSVSKEPQRVQPHIVKCFEGVKRLSLQDGVVLAMSSSEGECVDFLEAVNPTAFQFVAEKWLGAVETQMIATLKSQIASCFTDFMSTRDRGDLFQWILRWPGQAVLTAYLIGWTGLVETSLGGGIGECLAETKTFLDRIVEGVRSAIRGPVFATLQALVVLQVHARDILELLEAEQVDIVSHFSWVSQLRYYRVANNGIHCCQTVATLPYGFEYLGNSPRLVVTPLTDRCYRTLTAAYHHNYGGAPEGPAGTGKTETTKDLAKAVGKQCVVFNCSDQIKVFEMEKMLRGLAACGAWGCFDEFNRIELQVLSVLAQQVLAIQLSVSQNKTEFLLGENWCALKPGCCMYITMNPGYAGRAELPDNLKFLFRPVAMMVPDYALIAENSLFSSGFLHATVLAKKITLVYKLCSEQLSSQAHYDYGMRAVKSVLLAAQNLRLEDSTQPEAAIVARAIRIVNEPKFLPDDAILFDGIVNDLFPSLAEDTPVLIPNWDETLLLAANACDLTVTQNLKLKILQLYETVKVRHGIILVGGPGTGKNSTIKCLAHAITKIYEEVKVHSINPKAVSLGDLYGRSEASGAEWHDGILSSTFRSCAFDESPNRKWIVLDGPVDAIWIENMNTVLDDNKKLCLTNGDIIRMSPEMTMMFVCGDLRAASPATVSRCGVIFFGSDDVSAETLVNNFLRSYKEPSKLSSRMALLFETLLQAVEVSPSIITQWVSKNCSVLQALSLLQSNLHLAPSGGDVVPQWAEFQALLAVLWAFGGSLSSSAREVLERDLRAAVGAKSTFGWTLPETSLFHCEPTLRDGEVTWIDHPRENTLECPFHERFISIPEQAAVAHQACKLVKFGLPFLLVGSSGSGKTAVLQQVLSALPGDFVQGTVHCSAETTARSVEQVLLHKVEKRSMGVLGPAPTKTLIFVIDDVGLPDPDAYGARPPLEVVRQLLVQRGFYRTGKRVEFSRLEDVQFCATMQPLPSGSQPISARLLSKFFPLQLPQPEAASLKLIINELLEDVLLRPGLVPGVRSFRDNIAAFLVDVFYSVQKTFLPTPHNPHYTFSLRHILRILQGCYSLDVGSVRNEIDVFDAIIHECSRVLGDPLTTTKDKDCFAEILRNSSERKLKHSFASTDMTFAEFQHNDSTGYRRYAGIETIRCELETLVASFNSEAIPVNKVDVVLFEYVVQHVLRITRIIQQPLGHAVLLGLGGSGRRTCAKLACLAASYTHRTVTPSSSYTREVWREDLGSFLRFAGEKGNPTAFVYADNCITTEVFLEDASNLMNSGEIPGLFSTEGIDSITDSLRTIARQQGIEPSKEACWSLFVKRCRLNAHLIFCVSPEGSAFRTRVRRFPSLVSCGNVDYFDQWPIEGLRGVAHHKLSKLTVGVSAVDGLVDTLTMAHDAAVTESSAKHSVRAQVTPAKFFDALKAFDAVLAQQVNRLQETKGRYRHGVDVIDQTEESISAMQLALEVNAPKLALATQETEQILNTIDRDTALADAEREKVAVEEALANRIADEANKVKLECESSLSEVLPALEAAMDAVSSIDKRQLVEIRSIQAPTDKVKKVVEAVCVLLEIPPKEIRDPHSTAKTYDYWTPAKSKVMVDVETFRGLLMNYDKENMKPEIFESRIQPYIQDKSFRPEAVANVSKALVGLCNWVLAMEIYYRVSKKVRPKQVRLAQAQLEFQRASEELATKKEALRSIDERLATLRDSLAATAKKKADLEAEQSSMELKIGRARRILAGFRTERTRYIQEISRASSEESTVQGDALLSALSLVYLGQFSQEVREHHRSRMKQRLLQNNIPFSLAYSLESNMSSSLTILQWRACKLPADVFSTESAITIMNGYRVPYIVDPQNQANYWIKALDRSDTRPQDRPAMKVIQTAHRDFRKIVAQAVQTGAWLLVENCGETVDPYLNPILLNQFQRLGDRKIVCLGESSIEVKDTFKLFLTSKIGQPTLLPDTTSKVNVVAFFVTSTGLRDQALQRIIQHEHKDLEEKKARFIEQGAAGRLQRKQIEDAMLGLLASEADLLETDEVILQLESSNRTTLVLEQRLQEIDEFNKTYEKVRSRFSELGLTVSKLFFTLVSLSALDSMYKYSLGWYLSILDTIMTEAVAVEDEELAQRLHRLQASFITALFGLVSITLFVRHRKTFTLLVASAIGGVPPEELHFFVTGGASLDRGVAARERPLWLPPTSFEALCKLQDAIPTTFGQILDYVVLEPRSSRFQEYLAADTRVAICPEAPEFSPFQRLIISRCLRIDCLSRRCDEYIGQSLGGTFLTPVVSNLNSVLNASKNPLVPILFLLAPGADPLQSIATAAQDRGMWDRFDSLSLGFGLQEKALRLVETAVRQGRWVLLQNCHLFPEFLPDLELCIESLTLLAPKQVDRSFRLWLTTMPTPYFPEGLLQVAQKLVSEPPGGVKENLMRCYSGGSILPVLERMDKAKPDLWKRLSYNLCLLFSTLQERREYGSIGWNSRYDFTDADLTISLHHLREFCSQDTNRFDGIQYLISECNFGGRVTDPNDRSLLGALVVQFMSAEGGSHANDGWKRTHQPPGFEISQIASFLPSLDSEAPPNLFGLHQNSVAFRDERDARFLLDCLNLSYTRHSDDNQGATNQIEDLCCQILLRIREPFDLAAAARLRPSSYLNSLNTVLLQEIQRFNKLTGKIRESTVALLSALKGESILTQELDAQATAFARGLIPTSWKPFSYPTEKNVLGHYISDLAKRLQIIDQWMQAGPPTLHWLGGYFFPQCFLTAVLQNFARIRKIPIDSLVWQAKPCVDQPILGTGDGGCVITGVSLEGASWDYEIGSLMELQGRDTAVPIPFLVLTPVSTLEFSTKNVYRCPLYRTAQRSGTLTTTGLSSNFIMYLDFPLGTYTCQHWTKRGVAAIAAVE
jgi:dynein heavy chain